MLAEVWSGEPSKVAWLPLPPVGRRTEGLMHDYACAIDTQKTSSTHGKRHQHPCMEIIVVHAGALALSLGHTVQVLTAGDAVIFRGSMLHGGRTFGGTYVRTAFHLTEKLVNEACGHLHIGQPEPDCVFASLPPSREARFFQNLTRLKALSSKQEFDPEGRKLLYQTLRYLRSEPTPIRQTLHPIVRESLDYMSQPGGLDRVAALANKLYTSESYLYALYQKELNCSPHQMWLHIRIEQACNQILQDNVMVADLADKLGFDHRRCFERAFRKITDMCVSQYREEGLDPIF